MTTVNLTIAADTNNYDIYVQAGSPAGIVDVTVTINAGVTVGGTSGAASMYQSGSFAVGSTVTIINNGTIKGRGGNGGAGGTPASQNGHAGTTGKTGLQLGQNTTLVNNGNIYGGGGGGGGGAGQSGAFGGGGGGGGAGDNAGNGGNGGGSGGNDGSNGHGSTGGAGGTSTGGGTGGDGGDLNQAGHDGQDKGIHSGGAGAAHGQDIDLNGFTLVTNNEMDLPLATLTLTGLIPTFNVGGGMTLPLATLTLTGLAPAAMGPVARYVGGGGGWGMLSKPPFNEGIPDTIWNWLNKVWRWAVGESKPAPSQTGSFSATDALFYPVDCTAGNITVTLPKCTLALGKKYVFKKTDSSTNAVTIVADTTTPDLIDGLATRVLSSQNQSAAMLSDGVSNWELIERVIQNDNLNGYGISAAGPVVTTGLIQTGVPTLVLRGTNPLIELQSNFGTETIKQFSMKCGSATNRIEGTGAATASNNKIGIYTGATGASNVATLALLLDEKQNVSIGSAALATNATDGFMYLGTCAGTPTGVPTTYTGRTPVILDSTNDIWYYYNGSWKRFSSSGSVSQFITVTATGAGTTAAAPTGTNAMEIILQAGGGGTPTSTAARGVCGAGSGEFLRRTIPVTAGNTYSYSVGAAGTNAGTDGGNTTFTGDTTVWTTLGGKAGTGGVGGVGGNGGGRLGGTGGAQGSPGVAGGVGVVEGVDAISGAGGGGSGTASANQPGGAGGACEENTGGTAGTGNATPLPGGGGGGSTRFGRGGTGGNAQAVGNSPGATSYGAGAGGPGAGTQAGAAGIQGVLMYRWV